ncbi:MAG: hypothetical protein J5I53_04885 [Bradyrhizobiaceae bacterium]|nr:hypothetical protein [Bradyrhizobiaceae bacterium]
MAVELCQWCSGNCSLYAIVKDGVRLPEVFLNELFQEDEKDAIRIAGFIDFIVRESCIPQQMLRDEGTHNGVEVYAMYNHKSLPRRTEYSPSRLLCAYVETTNRILIVGSGFVKTRDQPIQMNAHATKSKVFLTNVVRVINRRIGMGEIEVDGNTLVEAIPNALLID